MSPSPPYGENRTDPSPPAVPGKGFGPLRARLAKPCLMPRPPGVVLRLLALLSFKPLLLNLPQHSGRVI